MSDPLPAVLPPNPLPIVGEWLAEAERTIRSASTMALATTDADGRPSARMVICRGYDADAGWLVFYSDRPSRKGRALAAHPRAAIVFYWEPLQRQIRIEGPVTEAPSAAADAYWRSRPLDARIAAIASDQSAPIASRADLLAKVAAVAARGDADPTRPDRWIGYRVWAEEVELWVSQPARIHDRAVWTRTLTRVSDTFTGGPWRATRLQP
jgi:pyridoxamine 5'-phosphate oxidase